RLLRRVRRTVPGAATESRRARKERGDIGERPERERQRRSAGAVALEEMPHDVVGLVHLRARVGIDEIRKLLFAASRFDFPTEAWAPFRAGVDDRVQIEHRQRLANLAAERAALEFVELQRLLGSRPKGARRGPVSEASERRQQRGGQIESAAHGFTEHRYLSSLSPRIKVTGARAPQATRARRGT